MAGKTKYTAKLLKKITDLLEKDTYSQVEICRKVGITPQTFCNWKRDKEEFRHAIEEAEEACRQKIAVEAKKSLKKKIKGFSVPECKTVCRIGEDGSSKIIEETKSTKYYPPDTTAIIFALTNSDPAHWKNRHNTEVTGKDGKDLFSSKTNEELDMEIEDLKRKLKH